MSNRPDSSADPPLARRYEQVKISLAKQYADDRMGYVIEKGEWVDDLLATLRTTGDA